MSKLILGSANFGLDYGVTNKNGMMDELQVSKILEIADNSEIQFIDTAQGYGNSETKIGDIDRSQKFKIITKLSIDPASDYKPGTVENQVKESCRNLHRSNLNSIMLHNPDVLLGPHSSVIMKELISLKDLGVVNNIGLSIYGPEILSKLKDLKNFDIIQVPFNVFDQQIATSGWSDRLKDDGIQIHSRSVFLQGLLLLEYNQIPQYFLNNWPDLFLQWHDFLLDSELDALTAALHLVLRQKWIDNIVIGVDSATHLCEIIKVENKQIFQDIPFFNCNDSKLINPTYWQKH
jgi:aryl-alcohol dehydrogenase-like predicted oxidoreductase